MADVSSAFPPLLFTLPSEQPAEFRTPRSIHSPRRDQSGSMSTARRSMTPGSVVTDTTPSLPPPIVRLADTLMDIDGSSSGTPPGASGSGGGMGASPSSLLMPTQQQHQSGGLMRVDAVSQVEDTWVTVFGFTPEELPLVLREMQGCGDILQWGTFGASAQANFMHVQFASKYGAQRALLRNGEQVSSTLIVGVKQLEPRHRQLVESYASSSGLGGSPGPTMRPAAGPAARPYRVDASQAQVLPQRSSSLMQKLSQFVLGL